MTSPHAIFAPQRVTRASAVVDGVAGLEQKAVVVHSDNRDNYQLAIALHEQGLLDTLVTSQYLHLDRPLVRQTLGRVIPSRLHHKRYNSELDTARVRISGLGLVTHTLARLPRIDLLRTSDKILGRKARRLACRNGSPVFSTSYQAHSAFAEGSDRPAQRFIFQLHPHPKTARAILIEELERVPAAAASLRNEHELHLSADEFSVMSAEPGLANGWTCASSFTARSLADYGVPAERIHVVPYGVDTTAFPARVAPPANKQFTVVFVGSLIQRKGLFYLLDAFRKLGSGNVRLVLCGRGFVDRELLAQYPGLDIEVNIALPTPELVRKIHAADLCVFPSILEGFAHVIPEIMACGVPVVTTPNTCGPDVINDGYDGFIIPIRDSDAIAERIDWGIENPSILAEMGRRAALKAQTLTWAAFRRGARAAYREMLAA